MEITSLVVSAGTVVMCPVCDCRRDKLHSSLKGLETGWTTVGFYPRSMVWGKLEYGKLASEVDEASGSLNHWMIRESMTRGTNGYSASERVEDWSCGVHRRGSVRRPSLGIGSRDSGLVRWIDREQSDGEKYGSGTGTRGRDPRERAGKNIESRDGTGAVSAAYGYGGRVAQGLGFWDTHMGEVDVDDLPPTCRFARQPQSGSTVIRLWTLSLSFRLPLLHTL